MGFFSISAYRGEIGFRTGNTVPVGFHYSERTWDSLYIGLWHDPVWKANEYFMHKSLDFISDHVEVDIFGKYLAFEGDTHGPRWCVIWWWDPLGDEEILRLSLWLILHQMMSWNPQEFNLWKGPVERSL